MPGPIDYSKYSEEQLQNLSTNFPATKPLVDQEIAARQPAPEVVPPLQPSEQAMSEALVTGDVVIPEPIPENDPLGATLTAGRHIKADAEAEEEIDLDAEIAAAEALPDVGEPVRPDGVGSSQSIPDVKGINEGQLDKILGQTDKAYDDIQSAMQRGADAGKIKAASTMAEIQERQRQLEIHNQKAAEAEQIRQQKLQEGEEKYNEISKEIAETKIDSGRLWANANTGQKILAGIGMALSTLGGPQAVSNSIDIINDAIDRDINEQKANLANKRTSLTAQDNLLGRMRQRFGDERLAEQAAKVALLERSRLKMEEFAAKAQSPQLQAQADKAIAQIQLTEAQGKQALAASMQAAANKAASEQVFQQDILPLDYKPQSKEERELFVKGVGLAPDKQTAKELRDGKAAYEESMSLLQQLMDTRDEYGAEVLDREVVNAQKSRATQMLLKAKEAANLGVMSATDFELMNRLVPEDPTEIGFVQSKLKELQRQIKAGHQAQLRNKVTVPVAPITMK